MRDLIRDATSHCI